MKKIIEKKDVAVNELAKDLVNAKSIVMFEYFSLSAKQITALRNLLHKVQAKMYVAKNNIIARAFAKANIAEFKEAIGPNALLIANGDEIAPFRELHKIFKDNKKIIYKFGVLESKVVDANQFATIASLPNRAGLISMLLSCLQAPIRNLAYGLSSISNKKQ
jgi:large subunit ribosomal protein L10